MFASVPNQKPGKSPIEEYLKSLHSRHASSTEGQVADYIPELAKADPKWFGICIATRDGHVYEIGDTRQHFTIQSISKALAYGLALEDRGEDFMLSHVGVEPSGDAFNAISLKPGSGAPFNPMINAGAIATDGQVVTKNGLTRIQRLLNYLSACAGRSLDIDKIVYKSESETGHRNRAIGWMLRNFGIIEDEPTDILETYFQQCSIRVTCRDLALIGATLANQGRNPLTSEQAILPDYVENILSVMSTCGMYDYSGEWLYRVGLPAKSGVGGGILAVLPGQLGIGIFSPPLDAQGNSARGIKVCEDLSRDLSLHLFANGAAPQPALRLTYDGSQVSSRRRRRPAQQKILRSSGHRIRIIDLQGELIFSTFEPVVRLALKQAPYCQYQILDMRNVVNIDLVSMRLISELQTSLATLGVKMMICNCERFARDFHQNGLDKVQYLDEDTALEYCENMLLSELAEPGWDAVSSVSLSSCLLASELNEAELSWLEKQMSHEEANEGEYLIHSDDASESLYLLMSGSVEVRLPSESGANGKRIDVFEAGMTFGEMGFLDGSPRSADVVALEHVCYRGISRELLKKIEDEHPKLKIKLLEHLSRLLSYNLRRSNNEAAAYKGNTRSTPYV
jgi:glutaminase